MMTHTEKDALLRYLDFQMMHYVERFSNHVAEDVMQAMYDDAYKLLNDLNRTLDTDIAIKVPAHKHTPPQKRI